MPEPEQEKASGTEGLFEEALASRVFKRVLRDIQVIGLIVVGVLGFFGVKLGFDLRAFDERLTQAEENLKAASVKFDKDAQEALNKIAAKEYDLQRVIDNTVVAAKSVSAAGELQKKLFHNLLDSVGAVGENISDVKHLRGDVEKQGGDVKAQQARLEDLVKDIKGSEARVDLGLLQVTQVAMKLGCESQPVVQKSAAEFPTLGLEISIGNIEKGSLLHDIRIIEVTGRRDANLEKTELRTGEKTLFTIGDDHYSLQVSYLVDLPNHKDMAGIQICREQAEAVKAARK
jgi:hypothetical protein